MDFDDSFFDSCCSLESKRVDISQVNYEPKRCELNWFTEPGLDSCSEVDFMLLKYRGDLLYFERQYSRAVDCYEAALRCVPSGKSVVVRELTESIARCRLNLKQPREGLEKALQLVLPPREMDSNAWKLIADCQGALCQRTAQVVSLQKCVLCQRHQFSCWTSLSAAYSSLNQQYSEETIEWTQLHSILDSTVTLFRPYFSWLSLYKKSDSRFIPTNTYCTKSCALNNDLRVYTDALFELVAEKRTLSLCQAHCFFPVLCSGCVSVTNALSMMERLRYDHPHFTQELISSFLQISQCACLLWARQLLLYLVRYSHSYVSSAHQTALGEVDQLLLECNSTAKSFLEAYFNKNRIFEESQSKEDKHLQ